MENILRAAICIPAVALLFASCRKNNDAQCANTITAADGNEFYTACGNSKNPHFGSGQVLIDGVEVLVYHADTGYQLQLVASDRFPFSLGVFSGVKTGSSMTGVYVIRQSDTLYNAYTDVARSETWKCYGGNMRVDRSSADNVSGTYVLFLTRAGSNKVISGSFSANKPIMEL